MFSLDYRKVHSTFLHKIYCDNEKVKINHVFYLTELRLRVIFYFKKTPHTYTFKPSCLKLEGHEKQVLNILWNSDWDYHFSFLYIHCISEINIESNMF